MPAGFAKQIFYSKGGFKHSLLIALICFLWRTAPGQTPNLFDSDEVMEITLRGDLNSLFNDRGDDPRNHPATIHYQSDQDVIEIPLKVKTRGHFRKTFSKCRFPPILLNFAKSSTPTNSVFYGQDKVKLVTPCQGDQYVIHEYLVYKLYNILTPKSFKASLVKVIYQDTTKNKSSGPYYGILLEDEDQMAMRNQSISLEINGLRPEETNISDFLKMAVFEYMIGNTDWSVQFRQNIKLIVADSTGRPTAIPYDFDHAGIVRAPYARPAEELMLNSTLERRYRGYCIKDMDRFKEIFDIFNQLKGDFYAVFEGSLLLSKGYQKKTIKYLDQFYKTINNPKKAGKAFCYPCDKTGTGNIVIKGMYN